MSGMFFWPVLKLVQAYLGPGSGTYARDFGCLAGCSGMAGRWFSFVWQVVLAYPAGVTGLSLRWFRHARQEVPV